MVPELLYMVMPNKEISHVIAIKAVFWSRVRIQGTKIWLILMVLCLQLSLRTSNHYWGIYVFNISRDLLYIRKNCFLQPFIVECHILCKYCVPR